MNWVETSFKIHQTWTHLTVLKADLDKDFSGELGMLVAEKDASESSLKIFVQKHQIWL